jgi:type I restriction enzyme S subunit
MEGKELPVGWLLAPVDDLGELRLGKMLDKSKNQGIPVKYLRNINVRWFSFETDDLLTLLASPDEIEKLSIADGDLLICEGGEPGRCAVWRGGPNNLVYQKALHRFRSYGGIIPELLMYSLRNEAEQGTLSESFTGSTIKHLTRESLARYNVSVAPLNEQRRIVAKLDTTFAAVQACRQRLDGVAAILKRFRQAVLASATMGELTREWREERGLDWSPRQLTVGDLGAIVTGNTPKAVSDDAEEVVPLFKPTELDAGYDVRHAKELMGRKRAQGARMLPPLSVLVTCIGATIGKTGLSRTAGATNQQINAIICNLRIASPQWIYFWFTSPVGQASIVDNASATTLPIINKSRFSALEVEVPDIEEQQEIVQLIESLFTIADQLEAKLSTAIRIIERLTPALLAQAFRGELVPQDPNDEPARVLLERIRVARQGGVDAGKPMRRGRRKTLAHSELSSLAPTPVPTNDPSRVVLVRTGDETPQGERGLNRVSKSKPSDYLKGWSPMKKGLIQILEQHQEWISASKACEEMGISDSSSSEDLESFFRQLKSLLKNPARATMGQLPT